LIIITAKVEIDPAHLGELKAAVAAMETASRAEAGCIDYAFSQELSNPAIVRIAERWQSMEALTAHFATPHMAAFNKVLGARPPKSIDVKVYEVAKEVALPARR
jgi:quinol monooxygenase YgiN